MPQSPEARVHTRFGRSPRRSVAIVVGGRVNKLLGEQKKKIVIIKKTYIIRTS